MDIGYIHGLGGVHTTFMNTLGAAGIVGASASTESMVNVAMEKYWRLNNMINHLKQRIAKMKRFTDISEEERIVIQNGIFADMEQANSDI